MACNSVAVTSSQLLKVVLSPEDLKGLIANILDLTTAQQASIGQGSWGNRIYADFYLGNGIEVDLQQDKTTGEITLRVDAPTQAQASEVQERLQKKLAGALLVAQQTAVLRRLAQVGKLSNIQAKPSGVVARLEIEI